MKNENVKDISRSFFVDVLKFFNNYDCRKYVNNFSSKNAFHKHFKQCLTKFSTSIILLLFVFSNYKKIINFSINININTWHFLRIKINIDVKIIFKNLCINIECDTFITDRCYVAKIIFDFKFLIKAVILFKVKEIKNAIVFFTEYITLNFDFLEIIDKQSTIVKIFKDVRIVNNFSTKIFIEINIIESKK